MKWNESHYARYAMKGYFFFYLYLELFKLYKRKRLETNQPIYGCFVEFRPIIHLNHQFQPKIQLINKKLKNFLLSQTNDKNSEKKVNPNQNRIPRDAIDWPSISKCVQIISSNGQMWNTNNKRNMTKQRFKRPLSQNDKYSACGSPFYSERGC